MGCGSWSSNDFRDYTMSKRMTLESNGKLSSHYTHQDIFVQRSLHPELNPKNILRECCDSDDHPNSFPVILALDVTGSMGDSAAEVAKQLNPIMTKLYEEIPDVQFMVMAIGDLECDNSPLQVTQFESDIRIAKQLDLVYFEGGGGGNPYESYTEAWYFGSYHCVLDCWKRGKKGLIITMGDEILNPVLFESDVAKFIGYPQNNSQFDLNEDIETTVLYEYASEYYDICHINVEHGYRRDNDSRIKRSFENVIGEGYFYSSTVNGISETIIDIIKTKYENSKGTQIPVVGETIEGSKAEPNRNDGGEIGW